MNEQQVFDTNTILKIKTGSHLYGTNTPKSDLDFTGVFIAGEDYYFGLKNVKEVNNSIESKDASGKNTSEAVDDKLYEIRNFANLALQNNPNIIETLFVNESNIIYVNEIGQELLNSSHLFPYKGAFDRFIGYASSQSHKMIIKEKHFTELAESLKYFEEQEPNKLLIEFRTNFSNNTIRVHDHFVETLSYFQIGDINIQKHVKIKKVVEMLRDRMSKISNRYELVTKYGYDTKFGSHLIRLLLEGEELLNTGKIVFPLNYADILLDIKNGKYEINELMEMAKKIEDRMREARDKSNLPNSQNFHKVNELVKKITKKFHGLR
jgi:predicted nucleotidyltransferase